MPAAQHLPLELSWAEPGHAGTSLHMPETCLALLGQSQDTLAGAWSGQAAPGSSWGQVLPQLEAHLIWPGSTQVRTMDSPSDLSDYLQACRGSFGCNWILGWTLTFCARGEGGEGLGGVRARAASLALVARGSGFRRI